MKRNRMVASALAALVAVSGLTACGGKGMTPATASKADTASAANTPAGKTNITFLNSKGEIAKQLEAAAKTFSSSNKDGITVTVSSVSASSTVDETMMSKYASGNPCTLNMVDPNSIVTYADKSADLSNEAWVKNINAKFTDSLKSNGKLVAFPFAVEGYGMIYNKTTIEKATKQTFDPASVKSLSDLETLYKKIQAGGVTPVEISHDDWSLSAHFLATAFTTQSGGCNAYLKALKSGSADISKNETYNGLLKLLDLNKKYNVYKASPMSSDYSTSDPKNIATGKVAFWFNGVWVMPNVSQFLTGDHAKDEFGFLPMYADSATSSSIVAGGSKVILIDSTKSTDAQRKAANEFLNWLVSDPTGQKALVTDMGLIPAFDNITLQPDNSLAKSIISYIKAGKTLTPASESGDYITKVGAYTQQYVADKMDKDALSKAINTYFKTASWVK